MKSISQIEHRECSIVSEDEVLTHDQEFLIDISQYDERNKCKIYRQGHGHISPDAAIALGVCCKVGSRSKYKLIVRSSKLGAS